VPPKDAIRVALGLGVLLPAVVAAAVLLPLRLRPGLSDGAKRLLGGLAIALGFLAGYVGLGFAPLKPEDAWNWLPWLGLAAAVVGLVDRPWLLAAIVRLGGATLAAWLLVPVWESNDLWRLDARLLLGLMIFLIWTTDRPLSDKANRLWLLLLTLAAAVGAAVLMLGGSGKLAQLSGVLTATLAAATVVMPSGPTPPPGVVPVVALLLPGLMASGLFDTHSAVPRASYFLPAFVVLVLDCAALVPASARLRFVLLVPFMLAAAVGLAYWAEPIDWREIFVPAEPTS
jgi:hypothetical protein